VKNYQAGTWQKQLGYQSFQPSLIDRPWTIDDSRVLESLSKADRQMGRLDMFSEYVPNLDLFVRMHVTKEATESSRIEDTRTEMEEAVLPEEEIQEERRDDWREVNNYIRGMRTAVEQLDALPFSNRLLCEAHATLMDGVRGEHKTPGEFRRSQNWIGGSNPGNARFVPPVAEDVPELMSDLEQFAHNPELHLPPLVRVALMHYQFETIHPFLDGNGRIGRLMVPLYLVTQGILKAPVLYLSDYLERNRDEYYDRLTRVREHNAIDEWLTFFLDGLSETAAHGVGTFNEILRFKAHWEKEIATWKPQGRSGLALLEHLFGQVWVNAKMVAEAAGVSQPTAYKLIDRFVQNGLLTEITGAKRDRLFRFDAYLKLSRRR
ncbi:MAG: Fic family protein, partial [Chthoniobacterales bacterium]